MHQAHLTESVRRNVSQAFAELGEAEPVEIRETILIREGSYCGRRFEGRGASAVWFVEENQLKIFRADGTMARVLEPEGSVPVQRAA